MYLINALLITTYASGFACMSYAFIHAALAVPAMLMWAPVTTTRHIFRAGWDTNIAYAYTPKKATGVIADWF